MQSLSSDLDVWERAWAAYDEATYRTALSYLRPQDVVLDIGAGDLRFARQAAGIARHVYAIEMQPKLLTHQPPRPQNLTVICADARHLIWPNTITAGVLLMRHCTQVKPYASRLRALGCRRLITNARWGMDVELMALDQRIDWQQVEIGWYACLCGQTGFVAGPPEKVSEKVTWQVAEVENCPDCSNVR